jgi:hypothetical protein
VVDTKVSGGVVFLVEFVDDGKVLRENLEPGAFELVSENSQGGRTRVLVAWGIVCRR